MAKIRTASGAAGSLSDDLSLRVGNIAGETEIMHAWENFLSGSSRSSSVVRGFVVDSWARSLQSGVDAHGTGSPELLEDDLFDQLRKRQKALCNAAVTTLAQAVDFLIDTRSMMILTDSAGVVLDTAGDDRVVDMGREIHLETGGGWSERAVGTNAIGTALATTRPVQVHAAEHFCEGVKKWTCAASPVRDPADGSLIGVLDISGPKQSFQPNSLALAVVAAKRIEAALAEEALAERARLLEACLSQLPSWVQDGVIALDRRGRVIHMNDRVLERLDRWSVPISPALGTAIADLEGARSADDWPERLPHGLRPEWLKPVRIGDETLGALLVIPQRPQRPEPSSTPAPPRIAARPDGFAEIVGQSRVMADSLGRAHRIAANRAPVLIQGETGVGKELFARAIHASGATSSGPFVVFNCGAVSKELVASELFGYVRGAFTGASSDGRAGRFELADGGTLCLDEIGEMPLDLQPYLLRVLEDSTICRLGDNRGRKVDVRLIALTNRNLRDDIAAGHFRKDLFYRISVTTLDIPPLRARDGDIDQLADHFGHDLARRHGIAPKKLSPEVRQVFRDFDWPGNVRELKNLIESLILLSNGEEITLADLPPEMVGDLVQPTSLAGAWPSSSSLENAERQAIEAAIRASGGNLSRAAAELGISRSTLYRKIQDYGIERP
ncbi:MAG: sigma-54-dependent Fis family transcriptional regulator [Alphaproteobacteria bacterium]|nr:sigma-54-dependent Fis family transcriptional regulator [Alphaproteobacteria bacterium]